MIEVKTTREFDRLWNESDFLVCEFSAKWCRPCKKLEPMLRNLERAHPSIVFAKVDIDEHRGLSKCLEIQYIPTVFLVKKGEQVHRLIGHEVFACLSAYVKRLQTG